MATEVSVSIGKERYTTQVTMGKHQLVDYEPIQLGGQDLGPGTTRLLLSSHGTSTATTMRIYADRKEWPMESVEVSLSEETGRSSQQQTTYIRCTIKLKGDLDEKQKERIYKIAEKCPIHKLLVNPIVIESNLLS